MSKAQFYKIIVVGNPGVGKTSFIQRYCNDQWLSNELSLKETTIGMDFHLKGITLNDGKPGALQLWDIAGNNTLTMAKLRSIHYLRTRSKPSGL